MALFLSWRNIRGSLAQFSGKSCWTKASLVEKLPTFDKKKIHCKWHTVWNNCAILVKSGQYSTLISTLFPEILLGTCHFILYNIEVFLCTVLFVINHSFNVFIPTGVYTWIWLFCLSKSRTEIVNIFFFSNIISFTTSGKFPGFCTHFILI